MSLEKVGTFTNFFKALVCKGWAHLDLNIETDHSVAKVTDATDNLGAI